MSPAARRQTDCTRLAGSCHCGAVTLEVPRPPAWVGACNCSLCRRLGTLWAYYSDSDVRLEGTTIPYVWGDRTISIHHCAVCGCITHWQSIGIDFRRMAVNARLLDTDLAGIEIRPQENAER